jgi:hypothetical protein
MTLHDAVTALAASLFAGTLIITPYAATATCPAHGGAGAAKEARAVAPSPASPAPTLPAKKPEATAKSDTSPAKTPPRASPTPEKPVAPPLDLAGLEKRLRDTKAIGVFTKLSLKNQVDDLLEQFKAFHQRRGDATLDELRERYNLLMLKVLSLLQSNDAPLARDLTASRDAIWGILTDPVKFGNVTGGG